MPPCSSRRVGCAGSADARTCHERRGALAITATRLTPCFAARIGGADITRPLDEATWSAIRAAFDEHSVLVFGGPGLDDEQQIAFSRRFGALEVTRSMNPAAGTPFARQSNLDIETGA